MIGPIYRVTEAGRTAWESEDVSVPSDYRRLLWAIDFQGSGQIETLARLCPARPLSACLAAMDAPGPNARIIGDSLPCATASRRQDGEIAGRRRRPVPQRPRVAHAGDVVERVGA